MRAILRRPDFRLLFGGLVASMVAESILLLALAIWVKDLTGSDGMAGATIFAIVAPMALAPLVGWMVDRFRRRAFFVAVNLGTAALLTPLYAVRDRGDVWIIYAVSALYGLSYVALSATLIGLIKEIVPVDLLAEANGALQTVKQGLRLVGPLAGAALYAGVGGWALATLGGLGFLTAAAAVSRMRVRESAPAPAQPGWLAEIGAGVRHMFDDPALRRGVLGTALTMLVLGFSESLIFAYVDRGLGHPPAFVGVLLTVQGVGGLLGGLSSATIVGRLGEVGALATGVVIFAPAVLALVQPNLLLGFVAMVMAGFALPIVIVSLNTLTQRRTPVPLVGRVAAASEALISGPQSLSIGLGAVLVGVVNYRLLFALMAAAMLAVAYFLWSGRHLSPPSGTAPSGPTVPLDVLPDVRIPTPTPGPTT
jgi:Na+/melibiose symporter-like transporter